MPHKVYNDIEQCVELWLIDDEGYKRLIQKIPYYLL